MRKETTHISSLLEKDKQELAHTSQNIQKVKYGFFQCFQNALCPSSKKKNSKRPLSLSEKEILEAIHKKNPCEIHPPCNKFYCSDSWEKLFELYLEFEDCFQDLEKALKELHNNLESMNATELPTEGQMEDLMILSRGISKTKKKEIQKMLLDIFPEEWSLASFQDAYTQWKHYPLKEALEERGLCHAGEEIQILNREKRLFSEELQRQKTLLEELRSLKDTFAQLFS